MTRCPQSFYLSDQNHTEPSAIHQLYFMFPCPSTEIEDEHKQTKAGAIHWTKETVFRMISSSSNGKLLFKLAKIIVNVFYNEKFRVTVGSRHIISMLWLFLCFSVTSGLCLILLASSSEFHGLTTSRKRRGIFSSNSIFKE